MNKSKNLMNPTKTKKLTISALFIATYTVIMALTASFSFGFIQVRVANALMGLPFLMDFLAVPMGLAIFTSNILLGGMGLADALGGLLNGLIVGFTMKYLGKKDLPDYVVSVVVLLVPALVVSTWLHKIVGTSYLSTVWMLMLGHIVPAILAVGLVKFAREAINKYGI